MKPGLLYAAVETGEANEDEPDAGRCVAVNGYEVYLKANTYFGIGHREVVKAIAPVAEEAGARYYCPDMVGFMPYMINKNGDSHRMDVLGLSIGRACTAGYVTAKLLAE